MPDGARPGRRWPRRTLAFGLTAAVLGGGALAAGAATSAAGADGYRTASVTRGSVEQRLDLSGSVTQVNQHRASFPVTGTVSSLAVSVGDRVNAGQVIGRLDPRPFQSVVTQAQATLAQAQATLSADASSAATASSPNPSTAGPRTGASTQVSPAQRAVQADLSASAQAARAQQATCAPVLGSEGAPSSGPTSSPTGSPAGDSSVPAGTAPSAPASSTPSPSSSQGEPPTAGTSPSQADLARCAAALQATQAAQQKVARDQQTLAQSQAVGSGQGTPAAASTGGSSGGSAASGRAGSGAGTGGSSGSTAARMVTDEAAVSSAAHALTAAQANLAATVLKAPAAGTVGEIGLTVGSPANASSSVVIVGTGSAEVVVDVPLARMAAVRRGLHALVTPAGSTSPVDGVITDIGLLPATSASATGTAYPVTVLVSQPVAALATGSRAAVSIVVTTVEDVLTVPTSAVTVVTARRAFVTTLSRGVTSRTPVTVGAVGSSLTEITQGLALGQTVVLADLSQPLPTNTTNLRRLTGGGGFGRPGGASVGGGGGRGGGATSNP